MSTEWCRFLWGKQHWDGLSMSLGRQLMSVEISVSFFVLSDLKSLACIVVHDSFLFFLFWSMETPLNPISLWSQFSMVFIGADLYNVLLIPYSVVLMYLNAVSCVCMCAYVCWLLANSMIECFHWFQKCNRNWECRCFYKDFPIYLSTPIHGQELM